MIVIGVGNDFRRDDGAGLAVLDRLRARALPGVTLATCDGEPARLIDLWADADLAVVVDAVQAGPAGAAAPGRIHELDALTGGRAATGSHDLGPGTAARLGAAVGRMPRRLRVYAIEGADFGMGTGLSAPVARAVDDVAARIVGLAAPPPAPG